MYIFSILELNKENGFKTKHFYFKKINFNLHSTIRRKKSIFKVNTKSTKLIRGNRFRTDIVSC